MTNFYYQCAECNKTYDRDEVRYLCPDCGAKTVCGAPLHGVLEAIFDYPYIKEHFKKDTPDWQLFSAVEKKYYPEYPVGNTPFSKAPRLAKQLNLSILKENRFSDFSTNRPEQFGISARRQGASFRSVLPVHDLSERRSQQRRKPKCEGYNLWLKFDGLNPSGSLKDRASFLVVAEAIRLGEEKIITASTGNAASALAAVCAAAGKKAIIFVPKKAPLAKLVQIVQYGAEIITVDGTYDEAFRLSLEYTEKQGGLNRNTAYHPLTIEGKKTVGLEIFAQNNFQAPDAILVPVGDGVIISGVYKAFYDLKEAGLIAKMPKLICVQAEKSNAIHNFITTGKYHNAENPATIADSISVKAPSNAYLAKRAVEKTDGFSLLVSDDEILTSQLLLSQTTGIFAEPAAAATAAALAKISQQNLLPKEAQIVLLLTGHGLKDIQAAKQKIALPF